MFTRTFRGRLNSARAVILRILGSRHRGELHRGSNRTQAPIGVEGSPLAQMRWVGKRLPDFFRRETRQSRNVLLQ